MDRPRIVGIGHKARRGKDAVADWLVENCGYTKVHWSDALYAEAREIRSIEFCGDNVRAWAVIRDGNVEASYGSGNSPRLIKKIYEWAVNRPTSEFDVFESKRSNPNIHCLWTQGMRHKDALLLQWWGTDFRRCLFGDHYWVERLEDSLDPDKSYVIPDTRFRNEFNSIHQMDGEYVEVWRDEPIEPTGRDPLHISECELDGVHADFTIINDQTFEDLLLRCEEEFDDWRV